MDIADLLTDLRRGERTRSRTREREKPALGAAQNSNARSRIVSALKPKRNIGPPRRAERCFFFPLLSLFCVARSSRFVEREREAHRGRFFAAQRAKRAITDLIGAPRNEFVPVPHSPITILSGCYRASLVRLPSHYTPERERTISGRRGYVRPCISANSLAAR